MKGATVADLIAYFKKLIPTQTDRDVATFLGIKPKALSQAKARQKITSNLLAAASSALHLTIPEVEAALESHLDEGQVHKCNHLDWGLDGQSKLYWDAWQQALGENKQLICDKEALYRDKEALIRENAELKVKVARLEEQLKVAQGGENIQSSLVLLAKGRPEPQANDSGRAKMWDFSTGKLL